MIEYFGILITFALAGGIGVAFLVLSSVLGPKNPTAAKMEPFECGVSQVSSPKSRFSVRFYLVAMLFIVFDIEAVFMFPWAAVFRELGLFGFVEMMIFIFVLTVGLVYIWKKGVLEWE